MSKCYMCDAPATTREHVPPQCLFPEKKDLAIGLDYRKQLISVPSCVEHNNKKSSDDEFLLYNLVLNLPANVIARNQYASKVKRAIDRNPRLIRNILGVTTRVEVQDIQTGEWASTIAYEADHERLCKALEQIGRALYFHTYKVTWNDKVFVSPEFMLKLDSSDAKEINSLVSHEHEQIAEIFASVEFFGENPEVFKYQIIKNPDGPECGMRLHFYEGCIVNILPKPQDQCDVTFGAWT